MRTETASVTFPATVSTGDLISVVEQAGYTAALPAPREHEPARAGSGHDGAGEADTLRRLLVSLALASPVAPWGAWPFHRAAVTGARHGARAWQRGRRHLP